MILAGGILHLVVVLLPLCCLGLLGVSLRDPAILVFLTGASVLYAGDAVTMRWTPSSPDSPASRLNRLATRWAAGTGVLLLLLFWVSLVERALVGPQATRAQLLGVALLFSGAALRAVAIATLGAGFRTEIEFEGGSLVCHGIYRFLRHPSEAGLLTATLGAAALLQSAIGLILWYAVFVPVCLTRLVLEERALEAHFGDAYRRYVHQVGGLLPVTTRGRE